MPILEVRIPHVKFYRAAIRCALWVLVPRGGMELRRYGRWTMATEKINDHGAFERLGGRSVAEDCKGSEEGRVNLAVHRS